MTAVLEQPAWREYAHDSDIDDFAEFCERDLVQWIDEWAGEPLVLEPFQRRIMGEALAFGDDGWPIWRSVVICMPRKNGKTALLAAYALYRLLFSRGYPEILLAASSDRQAGRLFDACAAFTRGNPELRELLRVRDHAGEIVRANGDGKILRMSSDPARLHGYNPSLVVCDELAQWTTPSLRRAYAALTSGGGARKAPQVFTITTAGEAQDRDDSILGRMLDTAVAKGEVVKEPGLTVARLWPAQMLVWNHEAPTTDPQDVKAMKLANPASWITEEYLKRQADDPELTDAEVLQLHGCVWAAGIGAWISPQMWEECCEPDVAIPDGATVVLGVDAARSHDSTSVATAWYREHDGKVVVESYVWGVTRDTVCDEIVPGGRMDLELVEDYIRRLGERYFVREVAYDPQFFGRSADMLEQDGFEMAPVFQSSSVMADAYRAWFMAVTEARVVHGGGGVLANHVLSTTAKKTDRGWRVDRVRPSKRIDAHIAAIMAHARAEVPVFDGIPAR